MNTTTHSKKMNAWRINDFGLDNLTLTQIDIPEPKADELLIRVNAVSLNFRDFAIIEGFYLPDLMPKGLIPVSDAAGTVIMAGKDTSKFKSGDSVITIPFGDSVKNSVLTHTSLGGPVNGGLAEYMVVKENSLIHAPANLSDEEASTLPIAALTAWFSLVNKAGIQAGDTVLIKGTGGVSLFGAQFAAALRARVLVLTGSDAKGEMVKALGILEYINYAKKPDWDIEVKNITNGKGAKHILEVVGGESLNKSITALETEGNIIVIGFLESQFTNLNLMNVLASRANLRAVSSVSDRNAFEEMIKAIEKYDIKPVIDKIYDFWDAKSALKHLKAGGFGKIVIRVNDHV